MIDSSSLKKGGALLVHKNCVFKLKNPTIKGHRAVSQYKVVPASNPVVVYKGAQHIVPKCQTREQ